jgi:hypothetical protein
MNTKTTLIVLIIAICLVGYFLVFEREPLPERGGSAETPTESKLGEPLFKPGDLVIDKIKTVQIATADGQATLEKEGKKADDWYQTQPVRFAMQGWQVRDILSTAAELRYTSRLTAGSGGMTLDKLGLASPKATITLTTADGDNRKDTVLTLGKTAGVGRAYVVLGKPADGATVYVISDKLHDALLKKKVRELRSTSLASLEPGSAKRVTLTNSSGKIELQKSDDGRWALTSPVTGRADKDATGDLIRAISTAMIDGFVQDKPADLAIFGLDKPAAVLNVEMVEAADPAAADAKPDDAKNSDNKPAGKIATYKLAVGLPVDLSKEKYFAMWQDAPVVFTLRKADVEKLLKKPDDLRDQKLTAVARSEVRDISIDQGKAGKVHLIQEEGTWKFGDPKPDFTLDPGVTDELLTAIFESKAASFVPADPAKLGSPVAEISLGVVAKPEPEKLKVYNGDTGKLIVVRGGESTGYVIERDKLAVALKPAMAFRNRNVLDVNEAALASLHIKRTGEFPAEYTINRAKPEPEGPPAPGSENKPKDAAKPGDWQLTGFDQAAVRNLISKIAPLRATEWLLETPPNAPEGVTLDITLADGKQRKVKFDPQSLTASIDGVPALFKAEDTLASAATAELKNPVLLPYDNDQIKHVKIGGLVIKKEEGKFSMTGPGTLNETKAGQMFDGLASLTVGHFVDAARATGNPTSTVEVTANNGAETKTYTLKLWIPKDGDAVGQLGDKTFVLNRERALSISTPPVQTAADAKKQSK